VSFPIPFATTQVGSYPHTEAGDLCQTLAHCLDIPVWPQLPRRTFRENMYVQYASRFPGAVIDEAQEKVIVDTSSDLSPAIEELFSHYLADDLVWFALDPEYAAGFYAMLDALKGIPGEWVKGQVTGPFSVGLTITDQNRRAVMYDDLLADAVIKHLAMSARWQTRRLKAVRPNVLMSIDEPYLAAFGSAYINLSREQVIAGLDEAFAAIHTEGGTAAVHCCANTDWSVLLGTTVDVLNLDAFGYLENLALYPAELRAFLDRGGAVAWGIIPNTETIFSHSPAQLAERLRVGLALISQKAKARGISITVEELASASLITPSCGLGPATVEVAEAALETQLATAELLRKG
jgi:methionine synthase II (cobalamin-independent)